MEVQDHAVNSAMIDVSVVIASYNSSQFLEQAVQSALDQAGVAVEVLIVDDHSRDGSFGLALALAERDSRVRVFQTRENGGPAVARNVGFAQAKGRWIGVLDSDDLMAPGRLAGLLGASGEGEADILADDLLVFEDGSDIREGFLGTARAGAGTFVSLADYLAETRMYGSYPNLGFLKPLFRTVFLREHRLGYDENLRIAEDDDLILQCLCAGAVYRIEPAPTYLYRKHAASISHRLRPEDIDRMLARERARLSQLEKGTPPVRRAAKRRYRAMLNAWAFTYAMEAVKQGRVGKALSLLLVHPGAIRLLSMPIASTLKRFAAR